LNQLAIVGWPIGHSLSPVMYNAAFPAMGIAAKYEPWPTRPEELPAAIERLRGADMLGMNVTVPHKQAVMPLLDEIDAAAKAIGAVNCIAKDVAGRLIGHNTDKYGFIRSLREAGCEPAGLQALLLGSGGSARAVGFGLIEAGVTTLTIAGRTSANVSELARHLREAGVGAASIDEIGWGESELAGACATAELIVNCTPIGMLHTAAESESPVGRAMLKPGQWVYDLVYNPIETVLLREASAAGARPVGGLEMLVYQAVESVRHWTEREAPVDIMRDAARQALKG
jgi:shikimate dehydrogenase